MQKRQEDMKRLEEARLRDVRERELRQPPRPKSAPLQDQSGGQNGQPSRTQLGGPQKFATMRRMRDDKDGMANG